MAEAVTTTTGGHTPLTDTTLELLQRGNIREFNELRTQGNFASLNLQEANLREANLREANLEGAYLHNVKNLPIPKEDAQKKGSFF